jgi:uncharacterized protein YbaA (DUF1428 family)
MKYVDGFVFVVPKKNLEAYKEMATDASKIWMKYGALDYKECIGEDMDPNAAMDSEWKTLTFPQMTQCGPDEVVGFAYIVYNSRAHRDEVNKKVMADPYMSESPNKDKPMPFDMKRMAVGGFETIVDALS